jgi:hypothetical protein
MKDFIPLPNEETIKNLRLSFSSTDSLIPFTTGTSFRQMSESCLVVLFRNDTSDAEAIKQEINARNFVSTITRNHVIEFKIISKYFNKIILLIWGKKN